MSKCLGRDILVRQHSKSIELPATSRHRRDMTERLLKVALNPKSNKQIRSGHSILVYSA